jgi:hypothetical protein
MPNDATNADARHRLGLVGTAREKDNAGTDYGDEKRSGVPLVVGA